MLCIALSSWLSTCLSTTQPSLFWPLIISSGHRFLGNYYFTCRFSIAFQVIFFEKPWSSIFRISFCTINDFNACFSCSNYLLVTDFNDFFLVIVVSLVWSLRIRERPFLLPVVKRWSKFLRGPSFTCSLIRWSTHRILRSLFRLVGTLSSLHLFEGGC